MRRFLAFLMGLFGLLLLAGSSAHFDDAAFSPRKIVMRITRESSGGIRIRAPFRLIGVWRVSSTDRSVGGISGLAAHQGRLFAVTDTGALISFRWGKRAQMVDATIRGIPGGCGLDSQKTSRDSESITIHPKTGRALIGFEWRNAICEVDLNRDTAVGLLRPSRMRAWPKTGGAEAMTRLSDGRLIAIAERPADDGQVGPGLVFPDADDLARGTAKAISVMPPRGYRPTEVAQLPDGKLMLLTRSYGFPLRFAGRGLLVMPQQIEEGRRIRGEEFISFDAPSDANFEAMTVTTTGNRTFVWMMTDDNFMPFQRTLLVLLEYKP